MSPDDSIRVPRYLGAGKTFRLEPPRLRTVGEPEEERHATWFELFFDLVFAAAVSQLGIGLAADPSSARFARFAALFVVIVWAWVLYALYANRFDTDDLIFRAANSGAMLAIAAVAVNLHQLMQGRGGAVWFAGAYVVLRSLLLALYLRARRHVDGNGRRLTEIYLVGYGCTTVVWLVSIFVPSPGRYALWCAAMVVDLVIPTRAWAALKGHAVVVSHLTDRFATFFIIVLGESVLAAVTGVAHIELSTRAWLIAALCFTIALGIGWIYFDLVDPSVVGRGALGLVFVYDHFPLLAGVAAFGEGTKLAVSQATHASLGAGVRWALAGGIGTFALSLGPLHLAAAQNSMRDSAFLGRVGLAIFALTLAAAGDGLTPIEFVALLAAAVVGELMLEAFTPRRKNPPASDTRLSTTTDPADPTPDHTGRTR